MCLPFDEIVGYLHYYAGRYQDARFEHDELVNEAWIAIYPLNIVQYASQGIRWAMSNYKKLQRMQGHRGNTKSKIRSIDEEITGTLLSILVAPEDRRNQVSEDKGYARQLLRNPNISLADRLLIDQRYYQNLSLVKIGEIHGCTKGNIVFKLNKIIGKLKYIAGAA